LRILARDRGRGIADRYSAATCRRGLIPRPSCGSGSTDAKVMFIFIATVPFVYADAVAADRERADRCVETAQWRVVVSDRAEGAGGAGAARHLQQPPAPVPASPSATSCWRS
jgi:hypothetical protein